MFRKILAALDDAGQRLGSVMLQPTLLLMSTYFIVDVADVAMVMADSDIPSAD